MLTNILYCIFIPKNKRFGEPPNTTRDLHKSVVLYGNHVCNGNVTLSKKKILAGHFWGRLRRRSLSPRAIGFSQRAIGFLQLFIHCSTALESPKIGPGLSSALELVLAVMALPRNFHQVTGTLPHRISVLHVNTLMR